MKLGSGIGVLLIAVVAALATTLAAGADSVPTTAAVEIGGIVPPTSTGTLHRRGVSETATPAALRAAAKGSAGGQLGYHGGPVMHSNTTYVIYWSGPGQPLPAGYESTVNRYFADVAHDSGGTGNVYSVAQQYTDGSSRAAYDSTFGGSWEDTTPIPNDCSAQYSSTYKVSGCVLDSDLHDAIKRAIAANGWTPGLSSAFFVLTPPDIGSCADNKSRICAYRSFCAFHSFFTLNDTNVLYADIPFPDTSDVRIPGICDTGQQPNGNWGDAAANLISHEHNEMITDPLLNAWYDSSLNENGDKCAWNYGSPLGGDTGITGFEGALFNQAINGHPYYLQREWSNSASACLQRSGDQPDAPVVLGVSPGSGAPGMTVTITGTHLGTARNVKFNGTPSTYTVVDDSTITAVVPANATTGTIAVITSIGTAKSPSDFTVALVPIDFNVSVTGPEAVTAGQAAPLTVTLTRLTTFTGTVSLAVQVAPDSTTPPTTSFSPRSLTDGTTTSTLTVKTRRATTPGAYTITVTATRGDVSRSASTEVTVQAAPARKKK